MARIHNANEETIVKEMIRAAIQRLANKRGRPEVTKKELLKVLFKTKMRLPDGNPVKKHLAYYWYKEGPYSERVYAGLDDLVRSGVVSPNKSKQYETYRLEPKHARKPLAPPSENLHVARRELDYVVTDFVNVRDMVRETYQDHAPYEWYIAYKEEFKPKFESYCNAILDSHHTEYTPEDVVSWLDHIVLEYPPLPAFIEHRRIVMDFAKMLHAVMESDPHHKYGSLLIELLSLCDRIWDVFAHGVRLEHHDSYYDDRINIWRKEYFEAVGKLDGDIRAQVSVFDGIVRDNIRLAPEIEDVLEGSADEDLEPITPDAILSRR